MYNVYLNMFIVSISMVILILPTSGLLNCSLLDDLASVNTMMLQIWRMGKFNENQQYENYIYCHGRQNICTSTHPFINITPAVTLIKI